MKVLVVLMCALVAVQARSTAVSKSPVRTAAALGDSPWLVHLRIAVETSGLLETCAGSLIDSSWVLTAASCFTQSRFIWIRYGALNLVNPELVTENSIVRLNDAFDGTPTANLALISLNRVVHYTPNIAAAALAAPGSETPEAATFCTYNSGESDVPGEVLSCFELELESDESSIVANVETSVFDLGAPLVKDGVQVGVLAGFADGVTTFIRPGDFLEWIEEQTGLTLGSDVDAVVASDDGTKVIVVN